jgi:cytochrome c peroxidase
VRITTLIMVAAAPAAAAFVLASEPLHFTAAAVVFAQGSDRYQDEERNLNRDLSDALSAAKFTGDIEQTFRKKIERNLGRPINPKLANLGRLLWFDRFQSLGRDNSCGGCHSPTNGMGDTQPIAIGVQNNNLVGPHRSGPRNQRRAPTVINAALYPNMMWNSRLASVARNPFDTSLGFSLSVFPVPEDLGTPTAPIRFSSTQNNLHGVTHLLQAQAHLPPTELTELAGFKGSCPNGVPDPWLGRRFCQFDDDDSPGQPLPLPDSSGFRNEPIRQAMLAALNGSDAYRSLFRELFPETGPPLNQPIDFYMYGKAIAEFEFTLVFADAPLDRFGRGYVDAMTWSQKRGALLFFGKARCVECHRVDGEANEMFSDFEEHVVGVPPERADVRASPRQRHLLGSRRRRGLRPRGADGRPGGSLQVPHGAAAQPGRVLGVLPQRRLHASRRSHPVSPERRRIGASLQPGARRPPERSHAPDRPADSQAADRSQAQESD